jgi:hypothetical protein
MDDEFYQRHLEAVRKAETASLAEVAAMSLPKAVVLVAEVPNLGKKISAKYVKTYDGLEEKYADELEKLAAVALRHYWLACWRGANYFRYGIELGVMGENDHARLRSTGAGYGEEEGRAWSMYSHTGTTTSKAEVAKYATEVGFPGDFEEMDLLLSMGLFWLHEASAAAVSGGVPLDLVHEAYDAFDLANSHDMWDEGYKSGQSDAIGDEKTNAAARTALARTGAFARRDGSPKHAAKTFVKGCWDDWQKTSGRYEGKASFARDMLEKQPALTNQKVIEDWCRLWERQSAS